MGKEIERKYLIKDLNPLNLKDRKDFLSIKQCYLKDDKNFIVRLRLQDSINEHKAFITIKGKTKGISRLEYEYEIPYIDALEMIVEFGEKILSKTRYHIEYNNQKFEVDIFEGQNEGLIIAELELKNQNQIVDLPNWIGEEISLDKRYFNNNLLKTPFKTW